MPLPLMALPPVRVPGGTNGARGTALLGGALVLVTAAFELAHLPLPYPSDQINYFDAAGDFPHPAAGTPVHQFTRFGLTLPLRGAIELLGYSEAAYHVVPMLAGLLLVVSVYLLGTMLFARSVGVAAAALTVANNLVFFDLLAPLPDVLATALFCAALVLAVAVHQERRLVAVSARRRVIAVLVIGALLGWSYLTREYVVFAWPLIPLLVVPRVGWRRASLAVVPLVVTAATELGLCQLTYGDPLARLRAVTGHGSGPVPPEAAATYQEMPRWWYLIRLPAGLADVPEGLWLLAALAGVVAGGILARRRVGVLLGWLALISVPLVLLGGVVDPSAPKLRLFLMRYWFPAFPAYILGGLGAAWLLTGWVLTRPWASVRQADLRRGIAAAVVLCLATGALATAAPGWTVDRGYRVTGSDPLGDLRDWLTAHRSDVGVLWTDGRTVRVLPIYRTTRFGRTIWSGELRTLAPAGEQPGPGEYVVLYGTEGEIPCAHCGDAARLALGDPLRIPPGWRQVYATRDNAVRVYRVDAAQSPPG
ncbi:glycosyltransferase family 39 protein [Actinopolymorpha sp. B9G3]|uniref:glycosyltransferase family 39 protein n=1 Tax=Actinopolymorpha sp. B9G3 TaxID=3158970 RepID=UPI0032D909EB